MIKKQYTFFGSAHQFDKLDDLLTYNHLRFKTNFRANDCDDLYGEMRLGFNISPDMVQEVDDLVKELAKKSGVRNE